MASILQAIDHAEMNLILLRDKLVYFDECIRIFFIMLGVIMVYVERAASTCLQRIFWSLGAPIKGGLDSWILLFALKCFQIHSQAPFTFNLFIYLCFVHDIQFLQNQP